MYNRTILNLAAQMQTPTLCAFLILFFAIALAAFLYFGTKGNFSFGNYAKRFGWMYLMGFLFASSPIIITLAQRFNFFNNFAFFFLIVIGGAIVEFTRGGRRRRRGIFSLFSNYSYDDDLLNAPYYQGYDPIAIEENIRNNQILRERENALRNASMFVKPYGDPMGNHTLQNRYCIFTFKYNGSECIYNCFVCKSERDYDLISFKAVGKRDKGWNDECFTSILRLFSSNTDINTLYAFFKDERNFKITEENRKNSSNKEETEKSNNKVDVNTASEEELAKLPGINVVLAKRIVSYRNEQGGFRSVDDFIKTMGMKTHYANKIKELIEVSKVEKIKKKINARVLDI